MSKVQAEIKAIAAQLRTGAQAPVLSAPSGSTDPDLELLWQQLEDQIDVVNQLVAHQEAALLQLQAIVEQLEQNHSPSPEPWHLSRQEIWQNKTEAIATSLSAAVETGVQVGRLVGMRAVWAMTQLATALKIRVRRSKQRRQHKRMHRYPTQQPNEAIEIFPSIQAAVSLIAGSMLLRILLDRLVQLDPNLWAVKILLMAIPAAVAVYRSTVAPQSGFLWGSRLTLILIGLLLGGRL